MLFLDLFTGDRFHSPRVPNIIVQQGDESGKGWTVKQFGFIDIVEKPKDGN